MPSQVDIAQAVATIGAAGYEDIRAAIIEISDGDGGRTTADRRAWAKITAWVFATVAFGWTVYETHSVAVSLANVEAHFESAGNLPDGDK